VDSFSFNFSGFEVLESLAQVAVALLLKWVPGQEVELERRGFEVAEYPDGTGARLL
jgi:hypothetical protein